MVRTDLDRRAVGQRAVDDLPRERRLDNALDQPLERARAEHRIVAFLRDVPARGFGQLDAQVALGEQLLESLQLQADDVLELRLAQRSEDDDVVEPVQELRPEVLPQLVVDVRLDFLPRHTAGALEDELAAHVRRHDDDGVPEVDGAAL